MMQKIGGYREGGLLLLRVGLGVVMILHGLPKFAGGPALWAGLGQSVGVPFAPAFFGFLAATIEVVGGLLLTLGLFFRLATLLLALQMIAALTFHLRRGDPYGIYSHPLALLIVFVVLFIIGPGRYSLEPRPRR